MTKPKIEVLPIERGATPDPNNINKHTQRGRGLHENSMRKRGAGRSIFSAGKGVETPVVMGGNQTLEIADQLGMEVINVHTTGKQIVNVVRDDIAPGSPEFYALAIEDNEVGKISYSPDIDIIAAIMADPAVQALKDEDKMLSDIIDGMNGVDISGVEKGKKPNPRKLPLDVIFTISNLKYALIALDTGLLWGIQSEKRYEQKIFSETISFIDNDYFNYNHQMHLNCVKMWRPKYCTVRDIMTEEQCKTAGIAWYSFDQIMAWADELSQYAENVIVIPKYDCIKDIPQKYVLGYSIPTSHGGTPLPVDLFRGHRIHLLGGSWKAQLEYMAELGEDVVSVDNNYVFKQTNWGECINPDGEGIGKVQDLGLEWAPNGKMISLAINLGAIAAKINELYSGNAQPAQENE